MSLFSATSLEEIFDRIDNIKSKKNPDLLKEIAVCFQKGRVGSSGTMKQRFSDIADVIQNHYGIKVYGLEETCPDNKKIFPFPRPQDAVTASIGLCEGLSYFPPSWIKSNTEVIYLIDPSVDLGKDVQAQRLITHFWIKAWTDPIFICKATVHEIAHEIKRPRLKPFYKYMLYGAGVSSELELYLNGFVDPEGLKHEGADIATHTTMLICDTDKYKELIEDFPKIRKQAIKVLKCLEDIHGIRRKSLKDSVKNYLGYPSLQKNVQSR